VFFFFLFFLSKKTIALTCAARCVRSPRRMRRNPGYRVLSLSATHCSRGPCSSDSEQNKNQIQEYTDIDKLDNRRKKASRNLKTLALVICVFFLPNSVNPPSHESKESPLFPIPPSETKSVLVSYVLIPSSPRIVHSQQLSKSENKMRAGSGDSKRTAKIQGTRPEGAYRHRSIRE